MWIYSQRLFQGPYTESTQQLFQNLPVSHHVPNLSQFTQRCNSKPHRISLRPLYSRERGENFSVYDTLAVIVKYLVATTFF